MEAFIICLLEFDAISKRPLDQSFSWGNFLVWYTEISQLVEGEAVLEDWYTVGYDWRNGGNQFWPFSYPIDFKKLDKKLISAI